MGYNSPTMGCGWWYDWFVKGDDTCGIADTFFTEFDRDNYSRGVTVNLIKTTQINIYNSMLELERDGQDLDNLPQETKEALSKINSFLNKAESRLKANDLNSLDGSNEIRIERESAHGRAELGALWAQELLALGGKMIMDEIRQSPQTDA